ncbi:MAG TPA: hypothetical protein VKK79_05910 [Candidatus Lokiarchaeia archaeon]|nr:hypothetical protein [Candidatus Lokiarchaeia archaeon]
MDDPYIHYHEMASGVGIWMIDWHFWNLYPRLEPFYRDKIFYSREDAHEFLAAIREHPIPPCNDF